MNRSTEHGADLDTVLRMARSFYPSQLLLNAVQLGVFTALGAGPATGEQLRERLGLHPRAARDFFDALVAHDLLVRTGELYANCPTADLHLNQDKPDAYVGNFISLSGGLYQLWPNLADSLRAGGPFFGGYETGEDGAAWEDGHDGGEEPMEARPDYVESMAIFIRMIAPDVVRALDWSRYGSVVDVGGSTGTLCAELVRAHPHLRATCLDLPALRPHFDANIARLHLADRIEFHSCDFFAGPLPEADVLIFGHILHNWSVEERQALLGKAFTAVRPGGAVLVLDPMIDGERRTRADALLSSLDMLLFSLGGSEYTFAELSGWMRDAGFADPSAHPVTGGSQTLAIGHRSL